MSQIWQAYVDASFISLSVCTCMYVSCLNYKTKNKNTWSDEVHMVIRFRCYHIIMDLNTL